MCADVSAVAVLTLLLSLPAATLCAQVDEDQEFIALRKEYYGLLDSIESPEKWREAVAQRRAYLTKLQAFARANPDPPKGFNRLLTRTERSIACDGVDILLANASRDGGEPDPLNAQIDVVAWVEDDHLRVALGNPGDTPKRVSLSLRSWVRRNDVAEWPSIAAAQIVLAAEEVVLVHFDGIPTVGEEKPESGWTFCARAALLAGDGEKEASTLFVQHVGGWANRLDRYVTRGNKVRLAVPYEGNREFDSVARFTVYVPRWARARRAGADVPLRLIGRSALVEAEHGYLLLNEVAAFEIEPPKVRTYDILAVPELCIHTESRSRMGEISLNGRGTGPRILMLGPEARVRRLTVPLPARHRFDAEPLSDDPARRAVQLAERFRTEVWEIREHALDQIGALGEAAVLPMIAIARDAEGQLAYTRHTCAWKALERIGEPAVPALSDLLDGPWQVAFEAAETLGGIAGPGDEALLRATRNMNRAVREAAIVGLRYSRDPRRVEAVRRLLKNPDKDVRSRAAGALPGLLPEEEAAAFIAGRLDDPDAAVRRYAVSALGDCRAKHYAERVAAKHRDPDSDVRDSVAAALGRLQEPKTLPALFALVDDDNRHVRRTAAWALRGFPDGDHFGESAVSILFTMLRDGEEDVRAPAVYILGKREGELGAHELLRGLKDPSDHVRSAAASRLSKLGYTVREVGERRYELVEPVEAPPLPATLDALIVELGARDLHRRLTVRHALAQRGEAAIAPLSRVIEKSNDPLQRIWAVAALAGIEHPSARMALAPLLKSVEKPMAYPAAEALARAPDIEMAPLWADLLSSEDFVLRARAAEALGRLQHRPAVQPLIALLADTRVVVRREAIRALGTLRDPAALLPLFERFIDRRGGRYGEGVEAVYASHEEYMLDFEGLYAALRQYGKEALPYFVMALRSGWGPIDEKAEAALAAHGQAAIPALLDAMEDPDTRMRWAAGDYLTGLTPPPLEAIGTLVRVAGTTDGLAAFDVLKRLGDAAREKLVAARDDPGQDRQTRAMAAVLLFDLDDQAGRGLIEEALVEGDTEEARVTIRRLHRLHRPEFFPLLEQAFEREDLARGAVVAATACDGEAAAPLVRRVLDHPDRDLRRWAERWLREHAED